MQPNLDFVYVEDSNKYGLNDINAWKVWYVLNMLTKLFEKKAKKRNTGIIWEGEELRPWHNWDRSDSGMHGYQDLDTVF